MKRIGLGLLEERKAATEMNIGKDILSLLVKANMQEKKGMSDDDVLARMCFLLKRVLNCLLQRYRHS